jgi:hypothetical protein
LDRPGSASDTDQGWSETGRGREPEPVPTRRSTRRYNHVGELTDLKAGEVRRAILVMAMVALLAGGCDLVTAPTMSGGPGCRKLVRQDAADYVNFVKLNGITYTADGPVVGRTPGDSDLGPVHARVRCSLREKMDPTGGEPQDGDAAYREAGSPLYRVRGYRPTFRLAARQDGRLVLFEPTPTRAPGSVGICSTWRARSAGSASTAGPTAGANWARSPTPSRWRPWSGCFMAARWISAAATSEQHVRLVAFHLRDGTATVRTYDPAERRVERGILVPRRFGELVEVAGS